MTVKQRPWQFRGWQIRPLRLARLRALGAGSKTEVGQWDAPGWAADEFSG
jgi:hypothetical protein